MMGESMDLIKKQKKSLQFTNHYAIITNVRKTFSEVETPEGMRKTGWLRHIRKKVAGAPERKRKAVTKIPDGGYRR